MKSTAAIARTVLLALLATIQFAEAVHLGDLSQIASVSNMTANVTANATTNGTAGNATMGHSLAVSGEKSGTKTMLQLWDGVRAKTLENKIKAIDEKFNICFM